MRSTFSKHVLEDYLQTVGGGAALVGATVVAALFVSRIAAAFPTGLFTYAAASNWTLRLEWWFWPAFQNAVLLATLVRPGSASSIAESAWRSLRLLCLAVAVRVVTLAPLALWASARSDEIPRLTWGTSGVSGASAFATSLRLPALGTPFAALAVLLGALSQACLWLWSRRLVDATAIARGGIVLISTLAILYLAGLRDLSGLYVAIFLIWYVAVMAWQIGRSRERRF